MEILTPRHIAKNESDKLGIEHGWYGIKVSGTLMTGPSSSRDECLDKIGKLTDAAAKAEDGGTAPQKSASRTPRPR